MYVAVRNGFDGRASFWEGPHGHDNWGPTLEKAKLITPLEMQRVRAHTNPFYGDNSLPWRWFWIGK